MRFWEGIDQYDWIKNSMLSNMLQAPVIYILHISKTLHSNFIKFCIWPFNMAIHTCENFEPIIDFKITNMTQPKTSMKWTY